MATGGTLCSPEPSWLSRSTDHVAPWHSGVGGTPALAHRSRRLADDLQEALHGELGDAVFVPDLSATFDDCGDLFRGVEDVDKNESSRVVSVRLLYPGARAALARAERMNRLTHRQLTVAVAELDDLADQVGFKDRWRVRLRASAAQRSRCALPEGLERGRRMPHRIDDDGCSLVGREVGDHDLFGDGSITCLLTDGHTAGHQSVRVRAFDATYVICGDCCYLRRSLTHEHLPPVAWDHDRQRASIRRLASEQRDGATLLFGHDPDQVDRIVRHGLDPGV